MAEPSEEWECSKENIRPIQQGRKQNVLKAALTSQPKDIIQQQKQAFENELRTYSGSDPLSVWYKYIKWVEQYYPKGGREGHIKQLVTHCLSVLKDHKNYFDDDRFIDIILKHANLSEKPIEVYNNMYSSNIGCKSAKFFIDWSWELEQLGNLKRADDVLMEGLNRKAEPIEKLQTYQKDFERRFANKIKEGSDLNEVDVDNGRSAFSVLKCQKKNLAPIMRTGVAVIENKPILGRQQPQPRSSAASAKVPFKIYNSENVNPLPVQSMSVFQSTLNPEKSKENERKLSKWNTVKIKSHSVKTPTECNPDFKFHCDDENDEQLQTPRSVPKTSNILSTRRRTPSPPIALFEPPDPLKKPMYPKNKVYGGAEEYSLEEIRAAEWLDKKGRAEQERLLVEKQREIEEQAKREEELKKKIEFLAKKVQLLENQATSSTAVSSQKPDVSANGSEFQKGVASNENHSSLKTIQNHEVSMYTVQDCLQNSSTGQNTCSSLFKNNLQLPNNRLLAESFVNKDADNTHCYNTEKIVRDLYNGTLVEDESKYTSQVNQLHSTKNECNEGLPFAFYFDSTGKIPGSNETNSSNDVQLVGNPQENLKGPADDLPFAFYHDPTEKMPAKCSSAKEVISLHNYTDGQNCSESSQADINRESVPHSKLPLTLFCDPTETHPISNKVISDENINMQHYSQNDEPNTKGANTSHNKLPFTLFCDPTETINSNKAVSNEDANRSNQFQISQTHMKVNEPSHDQLPFALYCDPTETISTSNKTVPVEKFEADVLSDENSEENIENIPPDEYVQEKNDRELAGILQPSKNVFFIPLEEQEPDDDDSDVEDDCIYQGEKPRIDETLIPPSNTEQFSAAKFLASTPYVPKTSKSSYLEELDDKCLSSKKNVSQDSCLSENLQSVRKDFMHEENAASKTKQKSAAEPESNTELKSICYSRLPNVLSVIMETSRENYSKSSSSSSSASLTKSNNLDQYSLQHFSLPRGHSKFEVLEPSNLSSVSEVSEKVSLGVSSSNANVLNNKNEDEEPKLFSVDFDPFDQKIIQSLLNSIDMSDYRNFYCIDKFLRTIVKIGEKMVIGDCTYIIDSQIAEGAYAKVYKCFLTSDSFFKKMIALKVCKKANEWEFYICNEIQKRLLKSQFLPNIRDSVMNVISAAKFNDGMVLISNFGDLGTLLDVVNFYKKQNVAIPEVLVMYFTLEILHIVSQLHKCNIIHGDIKPDNFLMKVNDDLEHGLEKMSETKCLTLIDFGRAIDLNLFDKGICFTTAFTKDHFKCNEMKDNKPWVFQLDWYGVLSCIHTMLFSDYMGVKKINGVWQIEKKFKRYWCTSLWEPLFNQLLNITDCYQEPDVSFFTDMIESKLKQNIHGFQLQFNRFLGTYSRKL